MTNTQKLIVAVIIAAAFLVGGTAVYKATRGWRNNNAGNIRASSSFKWNGQIGVDDKGFVIFDTPESGIRAMAVLLGNYLKSGRDTVEKIINSYAPSIENNTRAYIDSVAGKLKVAPDAKLSRDRIPALVDAIVWHENGTKPDNYKAIFVAGLERAGFSV